MPKPLLAVLLAFSLTSCIFGGDDSPYPPLKKAELVGCWTAKAPSEGTCQDRCFSSSDRMYILDLTDMDKPGKLSEVEITGTYSLSGNEVSYSGKVANIINPADTLPASGTSTYFILRDTLYYITGNGKKAFPKSDSTNNCRPHWRVFTKPADWDL